MKKFSCVVILVIVPLTVSPLSADNAFYRVLAAKANATFDDAVRGFFELTVEVSGRDVPFAKQAQALSDMQIIKSKWSGAPKAKLTRGRVAYMICTACGIEGGLTMRVFGASERYAFRECLYLGVWGSGNQRDYLTGGELMGLLKWSLEYLESHPKKRPPLRGVAKALAAEKSAPATSEPGATEEKPAPAEEEKPAEEEEPAPPEEKKPEATETRTETPKPAAPTPTVTGTQYVVKKGDTFANMSIRFYGTSRYDRAIMKANGINDPWALREGQTLVIPEKPEAVK